jgi:hypothetical protein
MRLPEPMNVVPFPAELGITDSEVERGQVSKPVLRFSVIVPGPTIETKTTLLEPEHDKPSEQTQLEIE